MASPRTEFNIRPNSAVSDRSWIWLFALLAIVSFAIAIRFAVLGYWLILPFTAMEITALAVVLWIVVHRSNYVEKVIIHGDTVEIQHLQPRHNRSWEFPLYWTRVRLDARTHRWYPRRLLVGCKGEWVAIGECLTGEERESLATALSDTIAECNATPGSRHA